MDTKIIEMAALGRALYPGMLYDCRNDSFIPGITLWDKNALRDDIDVLDQTKTFVKLAASDSISDKANLLNVSASLKASFLGGLVEVGGSAKYLQDTKSSARQCRVTMQYSQTTKFEQLTMKELGNITYPKVFEQKTATHVVTAVLYGASAFMLFDYSSSESENKQAVEGNLQAVIKKIPTISIEGQASLKLSSEEKKLAENINVTFYGDYELDENPTTYTEALRACKKLPSLLKERNSKGVPVTVWLYPLTLLDSRAAKLVREISLSLVSKTENVLEDLAEAERKCNDLLRNPITASFPELNKSLEQFRELHSFYKIALQKSLVSILPNIRSGALENKALGDILTNHGMTPFTATNMSKWLDDITTQLNVLTSYTSALKDVTFMSSERLFNSILYDPNVDSVVSLTFTSLKSEDTYLMGVRSFVYSDALANFGKPITKAFSYPTTQPWFKSLDISSRMRQNLTLFTSFFKTNINNNRIKFVVASLSDPSNPGTSIRLYQSSTLIDPKFQPVSKPAAPVVGTSDGKQLVTLSKSPTGETRQFIIEYRDTQPTDSASDLAMWKVITTPDANTSFAFSDLKPAQQYWVRYRAVGTLGVSEPSDYLQFSFSGMVDFAMSQWNLSTPSLVNHIRTKIMTNMGFSRWSSNTIKSEVSNIISNPLSQKPSYDGAIPGGIKVGTALYFQGTALTTGTSFEINLRPTESLDSDLTFYACFKFGDSITLNTRRGQDWEGTEYIPSCPITNGSAYDMFLVAKQEGWEVNINGQKVYLFMHRLPVEKSTTLGIFGDTIVNIMGTVSNWNNSTFGKELAPGMSRTVLSNVQSDVPYPVSNPQKNYNGKLQVSVKPGLVFFFQGVVPSDFNCFAINFMVGSDIAFHFAAYPSRMTYNSYRSGNWENEIQIQGSPFVNGSAFDILFFINSAEYEIIVNGLPFFTFAHRMPVEDVNSIQINADVFMNNFSIIDMDKVNIRAKIPANV
ncbi:cytolytic toxin-alpha-like [Tachysurus fulvidraco]|uniref:cytolytic toxin-alpha-like n=1 Tax=Tachysurus fulvidraco TaxID=1234273 RepID=UPI001FED38AE|nr:cytolytic toxin-alpha-like [Tachysurus fulvidraco]